MKPRGIQISVTAMLGLIACVAVNLWLFRYGFLAGFIGLNLTKHVVVAYLCQVCGVNRQTAIVPETEVPPVRPAPEPAR